MAEREILFRGQRENDNGWIEGILFNAREDTFIVPHDNEYRYDEIEGLAFNVLACRVDPETVGQYTGVFDKNKRKIFDGDILKTKYGRICKVVWFAPQLCWDLYPLECKSKAPDAYDLFKSENLEVIGNIYDNPEKGFKQ